MPAFAGTNGVGGCAHLTDLPQLSPFVAAKAAIQRGATREVGSLKVWMPASAGTNGVGGCARLLNCRNSVRCRASGNPVQSNPKAAEA
jgi:hypothetical protein